MSATPTLNWAATGSKQVAAGKYTAIIQASGGSAVMAISFDDGSTFVDVADASYSSDVSVNIELNAQCLVRWTLSSATVDMAAV